jgi:DNA-binding NtrC family response regulator
MCLLHGNKFIESSSALITLEVQAPQCANMMSISENIAKRENAKPLILRKNIRKTILIHSADEDLRSSLAILLQDQYSVVTTDSVEHLARQEGNRDISLLVVDLEKFIPEILDEFERRRTAHWDASIIVLYAFRVSQPDWEKRIRKVANQILYKPVPIEQILNAIAIEEHLHLSM